MKYTPLYYPFKTSAVISGKRYELRPSWDRVLEAYDTIADDSIPYSVRIGQVLSLLMWEPPKKPNVELVKSIFRWIENAEEEKPEPESSEPRCFDFKQDAKYIYGAFWQTYGIRLSEWRDTRKRPNDNVRWMHWNEFLYLFAALPEDTRISWIMGIRAADVPKRTEYNAESVAHLIRQKTAFRLDVEEEDGTARFAKGASALFDKLEAQARDERRSKTRKG